MNSGVEWSEPRDLTIEEAIRAIQAGPHRRYRGYFYEEQPGITTVVFGDGRVEYVSAGTPSETLEALLTINDKEGTPELDRVIESAGSRATPNLRWDRIVCLSVLAVFFSVLLLRPMRHDVVVERK